MSLCGSASVYLRTLGQIYKLVRMGYFIDNGVCIWQSDVYGKYTVTELWPTPTEPKAYQELTTTKG